MDHGVLADLRATPSLGLLTGPTPLVAWGRLGSSIGLDLYAKRDDLGGIGLGGNKLRKLDLILATAQAQGATTLLTVGGVQSNHCRITAAVAARLGMSSVLYLRGRPDVPPGGNLMADHLFGAEVHVDDVAGYDAFRPAVDERMAQLRGAGGRPMFIPLGGSTPEGVLAYVLAVAELSEQCEQRRVRPSTIVVAAGTGGTLAGITIGCDLFLPGTTVVGVSASYPAAVLHRDVRALRESTWPLLGSAPVERCSLLVTDEFIGPGYTVPGMNTVQTMQTVARAEGVLVDLTYTGKAMEGLLDLAARDRLTGPVVFWHTGGVPELFARPAALLMAELGQEDR